MASLTGNNGAVSINDKAVALVRNFSIDITSDTIETTVMGIGVRTFVKGLSQFSGSADIYFDSSEFNTDETTFNPTALAVGTTGVALKLYLDNQVTNDVGFTGDIIVTGYTVNSSMDGLVEASISFQGTGGTAFSTSGSL